MLSTGRLIDAYVRPCAAWRVVRPHHVDSADWRPLRSPHHINIRFLSSAVPADLRLPRPEKNAPPPSAPRLTMPVHQRRCGNPTQSLSPSSFRSRPNAQLSASTDTRKMLFAVVWADARASNRPCISSSALSLSCPLRSDHGRRSLHPRQPTSFRGRRDDMRYPTCVWAG